MSDDLPELDEDLTDLLAAERDRGPAPKEAEEAVLERVTTALGDPPAGGGQTSGGGPGGSASRGLGTIARSRAGALAFGAFVVGAVGGAWLRGEIAPKIVVIERPQPPAAAVAATTPAPIASGLPVDVLPQASAFSKPSALAIKSTREIDAGPTVANATTTTARDTSLAAERALVETGRTALARGDHASALAALDRHASAFMNGQLAEEREVLFVRALASAGRVKEAAERGARFRLKYPDSVMLPVVDEALR